MASKKNILDLNKISPVEKKMINEILTMGKRAVNKIMIPKNEIVGFSHDRPLNEAIRVYKQYHYSRYPVYLKNVDNIVGILYIKDVVSFWNEFSDLPVVEFVRLPHFVYEDRPALDIFLELQRLRLSFGVVIDEFGGVSGIITVEDLLEEIVGDIEDEFDNEKEAFIAKVSEDEYILNPRMEIDDFSEQFGLAIDDNDVSTVSGLIMKYADRIPRVGEDIRYRNLLFTVIEGTRRKIIKVRVKRLGPA